MERFFCILGSLVFLFQVSISQRPEFCPEEVITTQTNLITPSYPNYYRNVRCWYNFSAPDGEVAIVTFNDFDLPGPEMTATANIRSTVVKDCQTDYVEIYTGIGKGRRYCSEELKNKNIISDSGKIEFIYQSLSPKSRGGFSASVRFVSQMRSIQPDIICDSVVDDSKNFTVFNLRNSQECKFAAKAPEGMKPQVKFTILGNGGGCVNYNIMKYKGNTLSTTPARSCEENPEHDSDLSSYKQIGIQINDRNPAYNIRVEVQYIDAGDECSQFLSGAGNRYTINFVDSAMENRKFPPVCIWLLKVPGNRKTMNFDFDLKMASPSEGFCYEDQVVVAEVFDDETRYVDTHSPICGENKEDITITNSNYPNPTSVMVMASFAQGYQQNMKRFSASIHFKK